MKLQHQAAFLVLCIAGGFLLGASVLFYYQGQKLSLEGASVLVRQESDRIARSVELLLQEKADQAENLAAVPLLVSAAAAQNETEAALPQATRNERTAEHNRQWMARSETDPFVQTFMTNPAARFLASRRDAHPDSYGELFLTDGFGRLVATTNKLTTLAHGHKYWWKAAYNEGHGRIFFDDRGFDESVGAHVVGVVAPVRKEGRIVGILKVNLRVSGLLDPLLASPGDHALLLRSNGRLLHTPSPLFSGQSMIPDVLPGPRPSPTKERFLYAYTRIDTGAYGFGGTSASIDHKGGNTGETWMTVFLREKESALAPTVAAARWILAAGWLFTMILVFAAYQFGRRIARPLATLTETAARIGQGHFDVRLPAPSRNEFGTLAVAFNHMAESLSRTVTSRDILAREVAERKRIEGILRELKTKQENLIHSVEGILWELDIATFRFTFVSQQAERLLGYPIRQWLESNTFWQDHLHPDDRSWAIGYCMEQTTSLQHHTFEYRMIAADGRVVWVRDVVVVVAEGGRPVTLRGLIIDITDRKMAEEALRQTREMLGLVMDAVPQAIFWKDRDSVYLGCNKQFAQEAHLKHPDEIIGKTDFDLPWNRHDAEVYRQCDRRVMENDQPILRMTETRTQADGSLVWAETSKIPLHDEQGRVIGVLGTFEDITERRRIEETLRRTQFSVDSAADAVFWVDTQARFLYANDAACSVLGYSREELLTMTVHQIDPHFPSSVWQEHWAELKRRKRLRVETQHRRKDGTLFPVELVLNHMEFHGREINCAFARNITERRRAEERVRESEVRYRSLVENTSDGYWMWDHERERPLFFNQQVSEIFGYSPAELADIDPLALFSPHHHQPGKSFLRTLFNDASKETQRRIYRMRRKDGSEFKAEITSSKVTFQGEPVLQGVIRDVNEQERLRQRSQHVQKMEALGTFAGGIAHDFNNILGAIIGFTELSMSLLPADGEAFDNLLQVEKASYRARDLVNQILAFTRRFEDDKRPLDPLPILKEAVKFMRATLPASIEIHWHGTPSGRILADPTQIHQLVMNLCANAGHAMRERGGRLHVGLTDERLSQAQASPHNLPEGDYLLLTVEDTGTGMAPALLERIFDPFFTTKKVGEGTGMGLAVVHGIVADLGGTVVVHSELGVGSTFSVYLPKVSATTTQRDSLPGEANPLPRGQGRILLVDDEPPLLRAVGGMLESLGYETISKSDPESAWQYVQSEGQPLRAVITDQTMPRLSGVELGQRIRSLQPDLPVLICTGYSEVVNSENASIMGFSGFIQKPVTLRALADILERSLVRENPGHTS